MNNLKIKGDHNQVALTGDIINFYVPFYKGYYKEINNEIVTKNLFASKILKVIYEINKYDRNFNIEVLGNLLAIDSLDEFLIFFNTTKEPPLSFIKMVAQKAFLSLAYLQYSQGNMFDTEPLYCFHISDLYQEILAKNPLNLYVILSTGKDTEIMLLLKMNEYCYQRYYKSISMYEVMGATGQSEIYELYKMFKKIKTNNDLYLKTNGLWLSDNIFNAVFSGEIYPGCIWQEKDGINYFYDDFTDIYHKYFSTEDYLKMYNKNFLAAQQMIQYRIENNL